MLRLAGPYWNSERKWQVRGATLALQLAAGDPIGHPSCEGGVATGTHVHLADTVAAQAPLTGRALARGWAGLEAFTPTTCR